MPSATRRRARLKRRSRMANGCSGCGSGTMDGARIRNLPTKDAAGTSVCREYASVPSSSAGQLKVWSAPGARHRDRVEHHSAAAEVRAPLTYAA